MRLIIRDDAYRASKYIADYIIKRIKAFNPTPEKPFVLGLPTGSSPEIVYKILVERYKAGEISFKNVVTFNMDEYVRLPRDHPQSYHTFMYTHFFSHVDIPPSQIHILNGNATSLTAECAQYEAAIASFGGINLFLAGIGPDGHIAFNEPGSSLSSRTRVKTLADDTIRANARFFGGDVSAVPRMALTVGVGTVMEAEEVVVVVTGPTKAVALQKCIEGGVNHMWTLSALQMHPRAMVVADENATDELQVKTVKYFKSIEQVAREVEASSAPLDPIDNILATPPASTNTTPARKSTYPVPFTPITPTSGNYTHTSSTTASGAPAPLKLDTSTPTTRRPRLIDDVDEELTPDSMSSRLRDSGIGLEGGVEGVAV